MEQREWEIRWSDSLSMGVPEIDEEHRKFVGSELKETYWRQSVANCAAAVKLRDQGTLYGD